MTMRLSRRKIARYVAGRLATGDELIEELAALIIEERRERDIDLLVRDIEDQLAQSGMTIATVETAKPLSEAVRQSVKALRRRCASSREVRRNLWRHTGLRRRHRKA